MRSFVRLLLLRPILWLVNRFSSAPDQSRVFSALSNLKSNMEHDAGKKGFVIPFDSLINRFIIFSDQHKGRKNGADDFMLAEKNYLEALTYYNDAGYHLIALGDCEELWENTLLQVIKYNQPTFDLEKKFVKRNAFTKIFGNHDLDWDIDPLMPTFLKKIYDASVVTLEGVVLQTTLNNQSLKIFCTHGHQGDLQSDGNWFSKFFVTKIWAPLQAYLRINPNTPAYDKQLKTKHNRMMYEWSSQQKNLILITGHTHQPVFASLTHFERLQWKHTQALYQQNPQWAQALQDEMQWRSVEDRQVAENYLNLKSTYFNTGCCCYDDGDITGIEIADGWIRLIKWEDNKNEIKRVVLEEKPLETLMEELSKAASTHF
jgi:predicted phosphodiesterase